MNQASPKPVSTPLVFPCGDQALVGIVEEAGQASTRAVVIVVGGPQYRVGSHRQFTLLSRDLAAGGFTTLRFDHRGIGDSTGDTDFCSLEPDIRSALDALCAGYPQVREIVLWGLCDAASAIMMYAPTDSRVVGIVALNPWVRSERTLAQSYLSGYYGKRLLSADFWRKLFTGEVRLLAAARELLRNLSLARGVDSRAVADRDKQTPAATPQADFQSRMMRGWQAFSGKSLLILSGKDLTAEEFRLFVSADRKRRRLLNSTAVTLVELPDADHTFSTAGWRQQVAHATADWLRSF